jgi:2-oxoglutarate ferredoxin oxidoreductase subunit alpha
MMTTTMAPTEAVREPFGIRTTNQITIGIVGSGGDGVIAAGEILADAAAREGLYCILTKSIGPAIRGGESSCRCRMGDTRVHSQGDKLDVLVCFSWDDFKLFEAELFLKQNVVILRPESDPLEDDQLPIEKGLNPVVIRAPFLKLAKEVIGNELAKNIVMLGVLADMFDLPQEGLENAIRHRFARKSDKIVQMNLDALRTGGRWVRENVRKELPFKFFYTTAPPKILMTGNDAIAYGALHAGCRFMAGYPITPATEIMEWLAKYLPMYGGTVVQAEDEIAAVSMAVGASFAGVPAMTSSSGPGISLMQEMIGAASIAEIPLVVVNVQRVGPATGIPTKSEQADLMQAIHGGHGDGPRVVLAPCDTEDCYDIIHYAFSIAESFQLPVMVLSDQFIGQRKASFESFDVNRVSVEKRKIPSEQELQPYERFRLTGTGVSPMSFPGIKGGQYQASGIAHSIIGYPTSKADLNQRMNEKRFHKLEHIIERYPLYNYYGRKGAALGLLGWGSTKGVIREAVHMCSRAGIDVCGMVPRILYPLPVEEFQEWFETLSALIVMEVSYTGQFLRHLRSMVTLPDTVIHFAQSGGVQMQLEDVLNLVLEYGDEEITPDMKEIIDPGGIYRLDRPPKVDLLIKGTSCE